MNRPPVPEPGSQPVPATGLSRRLPPAVLARLAGLADSCKPAGRGWCAAAACVVEATVPKPGNVHPHAEFPDLCYDELVAAGLAIGPVLERASEAPLGVTIERAVAASRRVSRSNANLGIVLAITPLAAVRHEGMPTPGGVGDVLAGLGPADAEACWRAIATAAPGGLGRAERFDLHAPPPTDLLAAMRAAADRDAIAALWADDFGSLFAGPCRDLTAALAAGSSLEAAVLDAFLRQLARRSDSLIARRHGAEAAAAVSVRAGRLLTVPDRDRLAAVAAFDRDLRVPRRLNPGTTADLIAAALYAILRQDSPGESRR